MLVLHDNTERREAESASAKSEQDSVLNFAIDAAVTMGGVAAAGFTAIMAYNAFGSVDPQYAIAGGMVTAATAVAAYFTKKQSKEFSDLLSETLSYQDKAANVLLRDLKTRMFTDENLEFVRKSPEGGAWIVYDQPLDTFITMDSKQYSAWKKEKAQEYRNAGKTFRVAEVKDPLLHQLPLPSEDTKSLGETIKAMDNWLMPEGMISNGAFRVDFLEANEHGAVAPVKHGEKSIFLYPTGDGLSLIASVTNEGLVLENENVLDDTGPKMS